MTAPAMPVSESTISSGRDAPTPRIPSVPRLVAGSFLVFVNPFIARRWVDVPLLRATGVAVFNLLCAIFWLFLIELIYNLWSSGTFLPQAARGRSLTTTLEIPVHPWEAIRATARAIPMDWYRAFRSLALIDQFASVISSVFSIGAAFLLPFFVILPFGARPGPNRPCIRHVTRTILLGSGSVHLWGIGLSATVLGLMYGRPAFNRIEPEYVIPPILFVFTALTLWTFFILILAVRHEYRSPADYPEPHDPWCDSCGYNLVAAVAEGRCPECGRLVADSLGAETRPPTPWERNPSLLNARVILDQLWQLIRRPRQLFFSMPTLNGQRAAQRWLLLSMAVIALAALFIVPGIALIRSDDRSNEPFSGILVSGSLAMALVWTLFAAMMVGVETAGIATFSKLRSKQSGMGRGVYLAAAAKVTSYSCILMLTWVFLGGIQLIASTYWFQFYFVPHMGPGIRTQQVLLALSLGAAHIGGLLWYELVVYRGIRAIQYANK